jgi:dienelactone hydrolase
MSQRSFCLLLGFTLLALNRPICTHAGDPRSRGPFAVGVRTEVIVESDRTCAITGQPRTLVTEIWYPARKTANKHRVNRFSDFFGRPEGLAMAGFAIGRFGGNMLHLDASFQNFAHRGAEIEEGRFPLLIFSHGNGGFRHQNTFQAEYLASHGYVVAAPDHTGNAALSVLPDKIVTYNRETRKPERRDDRPLDVKFLITHFSQLGKTEPKWLNGHLVPEQIGVFGHSFGGFTACRAVELDDRIKAILPMTLAGTLKEPDKEQACPVPLLLILADADRTVGERGNARSRAYFEHAAGPKYLLNFKDAGHFTFTEMLQINSSFGDGIGVEKDDEGQVTFTFSDAREDQRITNEYSVSFFDTFVKQDASAREFLDKNHEPDEIVFHKE